jgi:hypothetical protein
MSRDSGLRAHIRGTELSSRIAKAYVQHTEDVHADFQSDKVGELEGLTP